MIPWTALRLSHPVRDPGRYGIAEGEVLFPLRAARPRAVVARDVPPGVIAVGQWAIIAPDPSVADPDYLAWYFMHPATAARLARLAQGSSLQFLTLAAVRDFEIDLPPLDVQRRIARASALHARVAELEQQLAVARKSLIDALTMGALRHASHTTAESLDA